MRVLLILAISLFVTANAWATPYWLINGGSGGATDTGSVGIEIGGTRVIKDTFPLAAEFSMNFDFKDIPSDTFLNSNRYDEPYTTRSMSYGPEFGYLFKSGYNLDEWVKNLTWQVGVGYALQSRINIGTGLVSGKHWQQGHREIDANPIGYTGLLYRIQNICLSIGYNNRRGVVGGVGTTW